MHISLGQRSFFPLSLLLLSLVATVVLRAWPPAADRPGSEDALQQAHQALEAGDTASAEMWLRAQLAEEAWHPGASRQLTELLLQAGDRDRLLEWMEGLTLGDARLAAALFEEPGFQAWLEEESFISLRAEARHQAVD